MATFVMMSMVFTVVLLKSAALPTPRLPEAYPVVDWIVRQGNKFPQVGDNLTFPNADGPDVERVTTEAAYEACNVTDKLEDQFTEVNGTLSITLDSATEYYFISPNVSECKNGGKLTVSVSNAPRPAASVGVLVPVMAVVMGFFF